jgi:tetratricopeptide (TPR) repeat protein
MHTQILRNNLQSRAQVADAARAVEINGRSVAQSAVTLDESATDQHGRHFLPRHNREFIGRAEEFAKLRASALTPSSMALVISAIDGMGGIGKTTLAVYLAHELAGDFPDGQYFVDLHGFSAGSDPLTPAQALEELLGEAGTPVELIPPDLAGRSALWRSCLAGKRVLVLLDNAADVAQVRPLLPGVAGALVIVTSRRRLAALEGAAPFSLDVLSVDDALRLFRKVADDDRAARDSRALATVVELCGRLPLAIRIAAARFRDRKSWSLDDLVEQLKSQRRRARFLSVGDRDVMVVLTVSYRHLLVEHQRIFRFLGVLPGRDFDARVVAALTGVSAEEVEECLEVLFEDSLLLQPAAGRYQLHDLVRDCARALHERYDSSEDKQTAVRRTLDYYLYLASTWCRPLAKGFFRVSADIVHVPTGARVPAADVEAVGLLDEEYGNFLATINLAREVGSSAHVWQLVCALQPYLALRNYGGDTVDLFEAALAAARALDDRIAESAAMTGLALVLRERGENAVAVELLGRAMELRGERGDRSEEAFLLAELGNTQLDGGDLRSAYETFRLASTVAQETGEWVACAALANNIGVICRELGEYDEALKYFQQARDFGAGRSSALAKVLTDINVGIVYQLRGDQTEAVALLERALEICRDMGSRLGEAVAMASLSTACRSLGSLQSAVDLGRAALDVARQAGLREPECDAWSALGEAFLAWDDLEMAEQTYRKAEHTSAQYQYARYEARAREGLAHVFLARGDLAAARDHWEAALRLCPVGLADSDNPRRHLAALGVRGIECQRCRTSRLAGHPPMI